eukprot:768318-Hanusia_phi.AAC.2
MNRFATNSENDRTMKGSLVSYALTYGRLSYKYCTDTRYDELADTSRGTMKGTTQLVLFAMSGERSRVTSMVPATAPVLSDRTRSTSMVPH